MTIAQPASILVHSRYGSNHPYLRASVRPQGGVEVRPANGHGKSLNRFWPVWLRELVRVKMNQYHTAGVELLDRDRDRVVITASRISNIGLASSVAGIAAEIRPLLDPPLRRSNDPRGDIGDTRVAEWAIKPQYLDAIDWLAVLENCRWSGVDYWLDLDSQPSWYKKRPAGTLRMYYSRPSRNHDRLWIVAAQLELASALAAVRQ